MWKNMQKKKKSTQRRKKYAEKVRGKHVQTQIHVANNTCTNGTAYYSILILYTQNLMWGENIHQQFSFRFSLVFTGFLVFGNLGNLEWEYILQILIWSRTSSHCYFCTTKIGQGKMDQILVPLPKMLNSMRGTKPPEHLSWKSKQQELLFFHDGNWRNYVIYLR